MLKAQPSADVFWWHGSENIGTPVEVMRKVVFQQVNNSQVPSSSRIHYFESPTGHFSEGHTGRYGRQAAFAVSKQLK